MENEDALLLDYEEDKGENTPEMTEKDADDLLAADLEKQVGIFNHAMVELSGLADTVIGINARFHKALSDRQISSIKNHVNKTLQNLRDAWAHTSRKTVKRVTFSGERLENWFYSWMN